MQTMPRTPPPWPHARARGRDCQSRRRRPRATSPPARARAKALVAPRSLKLPVVWRCSSLRNTGTPASAESEGESTVGVARIMPAMRSRARLISFSVTPIGLSLAPGTALSALSRPRRQTRRRLAVGSALHAQHLCTTETCDLVALQADIGIGRDGYNIGHAVSREVVRLLMRKER